METRLNSKVTEICTQEDASVDEKFSSTGRKVTGVKLEDGTVLDADVVVANPDIPRVFDDLLESVPEAAAEASRQEQMDYSCSIIEFNWCLKTQIPDLLHHNVFLSGEYETGWNRPATPEDFAAPKQHNFYCCNPVYTDKSCAPDGCAALMIEFPVANIQEQIDICKKRAFRCRRRRKWSTPLAKRCFDVFAKLDTVNCPRLSKKRTFARPRSGGTCITLKTAPCLAYRTDCCN